MTQLSEKTEYATNVAYGIVHVDDICGALCSGLKSVYTRRISDRIARYAGALQSPPRGRALRFPSKPRLPSSEAAPSVPVPRTMSPRSDEMACFARWCRYVVDDRSTEGVT